LIGVILLAAGTWIASGHANYKTNKAVVDIGVLKADVREEHQIPKWVGVMALGCGAVVLLASLKRRR
jgi:hypothetical protein